MGLLDALDVPIIAAPMGGGGTTPELVAAVGGAGGLGFLPAGYLTPAALAERLAATRALSARPFGVNLFLPNDRRDAGVDAYRERLAAEGFAPGEGRYDDDNYPAKLALLLAEPVAMVSFTFGCPDAATVRALQAAGSEVAVTVTGPAEARLAAAAGADAVVVQGMEAGAHRGLFADDPEQPSGGEALGLLVALRLVAAATTLPLVASGGIVDGAGVAAALVAGAAAVQLGTAFLVTAEAGTKPAHRTALLAPEGPATGFTRAFSGRTARAIRNAFHDAHTADAPASYPQVNNLTLPIRATGDPAVMSLYAGQAYPLVRAMPAADLVRTLHAEAVAALGKVRL